MDPFEYSLIDELSRSNTRLVGHISLTDLIDVIKLLVEDLVHLIRIVFVLMHLNNGLCQADSVLEARGSEALIVRLKESNLVEVAVEEACHDVVLVFVYLVLVEIAVLADQVFKLLTTAKVRVDRETLCTNTLIVLILLDGLRLWESFTKVGNE